MKANNPLTGSFAKATWIPKNKIKEQKIILKKEKFSVGKKMNGTIKNFSVSVFNILFNSQDSKLLTKPKRLIIYAKYVTVKNLLQRTKGAAAACPPKNIKIKKLLTNNQNKIFVAGDFTEGNDL